MREPVHLYGANPQGLCDSVLLCSRGGGCADELKCESLYVCTMRAQKDFVRCEPTRALYSVLVLAHQGFVQSTYVLVRERVQMSSCTRACTSVGYKPTSDLCFCAGGVQMSSCEEACIYVRYEPTKALCSVLLISRLYEVLVWNQYACVSYAKLAVEKTVIELFNN